MKKALKPIIVLSLFAIISGALLGLVFSFTKINQEEVLNKQLNSFYTCKDGFDDVTSKYAEQQASKEGVFAKGSVEGVYLPKDNTNNVVIKAQGLEAYSKSIQILVMIENNKIKAISVYETKETAGVGSKVLTDKYFARYIGVDISAFGVFELKTAKEGNQKVDALSGATKTSRALMNAMNAAITIYKNNLQDFNRVAAALEVSYGI
ncbi:MAG: FMN-binding protein [Clostridia bacterium]